MKQEERRARTIRLLVDEAARVIADRGYEGTTLELVAAGVGLSKGAVYAHFPAKFDLFQAVLQEAIEEADRRINLAAEALRAGKDPLSAARAYFQGPSARAHAGVMAEAWRLAAAEPALRDLVQGHRERRLAALATAVVDTGSAPRDAMARADLVARLIDAEIVERRIVPVSADRARAR